MRPRWWRGLGDFWVVWTTGVVSIVRSGLICLCVGGCAMATAGADPAPATYHINPPDVTGLHLGRWPVNIEVRQPTAARAIDTDRIMVASGGRVSYFAGAAWSDRLSRLLQSRMVAAMQDSGVFRAVLGNQDRLVADYTLSTDVRNFQVEVGEGGKTAVVTLFVRLVNESHGAVVASREFTVRAPASRDDPDAGVAALQTAFNTVMLDVVRWVAASRQRPTG